MAQTIVSLEKEVNNLITNAESEIDQSVQELCNEMLAGSMAKGGIACIKNIREKRKYALKIFQEIKNKLNIRVLNSITTMEEIDGIRQRRDKIKELNDVRHKIESEEKRKKQIQKDKEELTGFQKFQRFSNTASVRSDGMDLNDSYKSITEAIRRERVEYQRNSTKSILRGVIVTLVFALTDFYLLNFVFIASNMSARAALTTALLAAVALDAPPYFLGLVESKRRDVDRIWYLRDDKNDPGMNRDSRSFLLLSVVMFAVIATVFIAYFLVRLFLFLGGGDINIVIHSLLENGFKINFNVLRSVEYNGGDIISTFLPVVTSVSAFAIGVLGAVSKSDYIDKAITLVDKELDNCVFRCDSIITECNSRINVLQEEITALKSQIYAFYVDDQKDVPDEEKVVLREIGRAVKQLGFVSYEHDYRQISENIRLSAEKMLIDVNRKIAPYTVIPVEIADITPNSEETDVLDEIWVVDDSQQQRPKTDETIQRIKELEQLMLR